MGGSSTPSKTTQESEPWSGVRPYLLGSAGNVGLFPESASYYDAFRSLSPEQQVLNNSYYDLLLNRNPVQWNDRSMGALSGNFDVGGYSRIPEALGGLNGLNPSDSLWQALNGDPGTVADAFSSMGAVDPTEAYQKLLSGKIDNPYMQGMHQAYINDSLQGYRDALQSAGQTLLPQIQSDAVMSGMYGGSRQGIAEGLVGQQLAQNARDLGVQAFDSGQQLYGTEYANAQNRMANAAGQLGQMGLQNQQFYDQLSADVGLALTNAAIQNEQFNKANEIAQQQNNLMARDTGLQWLQDYYGLQDNRYNQLATILGLPQSQWLNALNVYGGILTPGAGFGGTTTTSVPIYSSTGGQILGGALGLGGLLAGIGSGGGG